MLDLAAALVREKKRESFSGEELRAYDESAAKQLLESGLRALGETPGSVRPMRCNDPRKQALTWLIKRGTRWLETIGLPGNSTWAIEAT